MNKTQSESNSYKTNSHCRVCLDRDLKKVLSLRPTPPANAFLKEEDLIKPEQAFPLELYFCAACGFVQLLDIVSPELLFSDYVYVSSTSPSFVRHFEEMAAHVSNRLNFPQDSMIVDIGSNDGILLRPFKNLGWKVLGIDPAKKIAEEATAKGIKTIAAFFNEQTGKNTKLEYGQAKLITATSVFPHIDNLDSVLGGVKELLADDGVFMIEAYYLADMLEKKLFDTIYHEHLSYFTVKTLKRLFERLQMEIFDVEKTDTHGGSLRVYVQKHGGPRQVNEAVIQAFLQNEDRQGLSKEETYSAFNKKIEENKQRLLELLVSLKKNGKKIVGYGAAAKGNTLLNHFNIGREFLDYVVDDSPWKQGLFTPGTHLPVVPSTEIAKTNPDYILILAWNFAEPIMEKLGPKYKFIIPVPKPMVIEDLVDQDIFAIAKRLDAEIGKLEGKNLLITGGSGFIGSYVIATIDFLNRYYFSAPCKVTSIDNHIVGKKNNLLREIASEHIKFLEHDVCLPISLEGPIDYIINAAGVASPVYYKKFPIETILGTVYGLKNTLELAREKNAKGLLYFSSSEIYGDPDPNFIPTPETYKGNVSSTGPRSCYDESKRLGETLALAYNRTHNVPIKIVRPFNVYGPGMSSKDYRVIPTFLSQGLEGKSLTVHDRGNQTRTFCYASDAIVGFFKTLLNGRAGEVYNIGNNNDEINMLGLAELVAKKVFKGTIEANLVSYPDAYPQDEPRRRCPDLSKAKKELGYEPQVSLAKGLERSLAWFLQTSAPKEQNSQTLLAKELQTSLYNSKQTNA